MPNPARADVLIDDANLALVEARTALQNAAMEFDFIAKSLKRANGDVRAAWMALAEIKTANDGLRDLRLRMNAGGAREAVAA